MRKTILHLANTPKVWEDITILDGDGNAVGRLHDCGDSYDFRYEVHFIGIDGTVPTAKTIPEVMEIAKGVWNNHLSNEAADDRGNEYLRAALDTISTTVLSIYDEFRMAAANKAAEEHRNVPRPFDMEAASIRYDEICKRIAERTVAYRGYLVQRNDAGKWWTDIYYGGSKWRIVEHDLLGLFDEIDARLDHAKS